MAFANSIKDVMPGFGSGTINVQVVGTVLGVGAGSIVIPAAGTFSPSGVTAGIIRLKTTAVGAGATILVTSVRASDGTNTWDLASPGATATAANDFVDIQWDFRTDAVLTTITINITVGVAACTFDAEVSANP